MSAKDGAAVTGWRRRVVAPIVGQLTSGVAPDQVAATLAVGIVCALFPLLGATTVVTLLAGLAFRMNQFILHTVNQLLAAVQLAMILVYVRAGEWIWRATGDRFTVAEVIRTFHDGSLSEFFHRFGWAGVHAVTAWAISAPVIAVACHIGIRGPVRRLASFRMVGGRGADPSLRSG